MTYAEKLAALSGDALSAEEFDHFDHIGVAFEALRGREFFEAYALFSGGVRRLADRAGAEGKFSATVTFAYMSEIADRMRARPYADAGTFIDANEDLASGEFLAARYSRERLKSAASRTIPLLPDLA